MTTAFFPFRQYAGAAALPLFALLLSACVSPGSSDAPLAQEQLAQSQEQQSQEQVSALQRHGAPIEAGDLLLASGDRRSGGAGKSDPASNVVPELASLQNSQMVVYGYTDDALWSQLRQVGIADSMAALSAGRL